MSSTYLQHNKHNMSIIDGLLAVLAPYECLGCQTEGTLLCLDCSGLLEASTHHCYKCLTPSAGSLTCTVCRTDGGLHRVTSVTAYDGIAKELVAKLKFSGARAVARPMASCLAESLGTRGRDYLIVPVPTATARARARGFDQAKLLARELSWQTGLPYADCLARSGRSRQLGTSRQQRFSQLDGVFRVTASARVKDADILLVDDVLTTGATLEAAAETLKGQGAGRISAAVFARA